MTVLVLAFGNADAGDDGAGQAVARRLADRPGLDAEVRTLRAPPAELFTAWDGFEQVVLIDAVLDDGAPGTLRRWDLRHETLPVRPGSSSHGFGLAEAVELARALDRLPPRLLAFGIVGAPQHRGPGLSEAVAGALAGIVDSIAGELPQRERKDA